MSDGPDWQESPAGPTDGTRTRPAASASARIGSADRGPGLVVVAVAIFLAIALIKPWPGGGDPRPVAHPGTPPPTEQPSVDPLAAIRIDCDQPPGWRIFSRELWAGGILRSWLSMEPLTSASGPLDPAIPAIPISPSIVALGYCAPWEGPDRPPAGVAVHVWGIFDERRGDPPVAAPLDLRSFSATLVPPLGALYLPPMRDSVVSFALWASGVYVFALEAPGYERWWAVRIVPDDTEAGPSATP